MANTKLKRKALTPTKIRKGFLADLNALCEKWDVDWIGASGESQTHICFGEQGADPRDFILEDHFWRKSAAAPVTRRQQSPSSPRRQNTKKPTTI